MSKSGKNPDRSSDRTLNKAEAQRRQEARERKAFGEHTKTTPTNLGGGDGKAKGK